MPKYTTCDIRDMMQKYPNETAWRPGELKVMAKKLEIANEAE